MHRPSLLTLVIVLVVGSLLVHGWTQGAAVRPDSLATGVFRLGEFLQDAVPPDVNRLGPILKALLVTVEMALLGTIIGVYSQPAPCRDGGAKHHNPCDTARRGCTRDPGLEHHDGPCLGIFNYRPSRCSG